MSRADLRERFGFADDVLDTIAETWLRRYGGSSLVEPEHDACVRIARDAVERWQGWLNSAKSVVQYDIDQFAGNALRSCIVDAIKERQPVSEVAATSITKALIDYTRFWKSSDY